MVAFVQDQRRRVEEVEDVGVQPDAPVSPRLRAQARDAALRQETVLVLPVMVGDQQVVVEPRRDAVAMRVLKLVCLEIAFERDLPIRLVREAALIKGHPVVVASGAEVLAEWA